MNKQKHLTQESRFIIEKELLNHNSFKGIARLLGKDCTTISKEIRNHICFEKTGGFGRCFNDCKHAVAHNCHNLKICSDCSTPKRNCWSCGKCNNTCVLYEKYVCPKLSIGAFAHCTIIQKNDGILDVLQKKSLIKIL